MRNNLVISIGVDGIEYGDQWYVNEINGKDSGVDGLDSLSQSGSVYYQIVECRSAVNKTSHLYTGRSARNMTADNPKGMERVLGDKYAQRVLIPEQHALPMHLWDGDTETLFCFLDSLIEEDQFSAIQEFPYVVVKPRKGAYGDGVEIMDIQDREGILQTLNTIGPNKAVLQAFVPPNGDRAHCARHYAEFSVDLDRVELQGISAFSYSRISQTLSGADVPLRDKFVISHSRGEDITFSETIDELSSNRLHRIALQIANNTLDVPRLYGGKIPRNRPVSQNHLRRRALASKHH